MANERLTEAIVRDHFKNDPLFSSIRFEEQKSSNKRIVDCLAKASKSLTGTLLFSTLNDAPFFTLNGAVSA